MKGERGVRGLNVHVLGTEYEIIISNPEKDPLLKTCDGYCDKSVHKIVVIEKPEENELVDFAAYQRKVMRHEIIHAFLNESGIQGDYKSAQEYGHDETMIDWLAIQFHKLRKAFQEVGCE